MAISIVLQKTHSLRATILFHLYKISVNIYRNVFKKNKKAWTYSLQDLGKFENGTLGKTMYNFITTNGFKLEPKIESHDAYHVLLGFETTVPEEVAMQFFLVANGKNSLYAIGTAILGFLALPEYWENYLEAFYHGRKACSFANWKFEHLLNEDLSTLKSMIFKNKEINNIII